MTLGTSREASALGQDVWLPRGFVWCSSGCCIVLEDQFSKVFRKGWWSLPRVLEEWGRSRRNTELAKCVSQSWQRYSADTRAAMTESRMALPVQRGFRNGDVTVGLAEQGSWTLSWLWWACSLALGTARCFKQEQL